MHSYGAQFCEVRVNAVTGETRVTRFLGSFDTGRILNAKTAASQFPGAIAAEPRARLRASAHSHTRSYGSSRSVG